MSISIRIVNPPENTYWWLCGLLEPFAGSNPLRPDEAWNFPDDSWGETELIHSVHGPGVGELYIISAYTEGAPPENPALLDSAILTGTLVEDGKSYVFDFNTRTVSEVGIAMAGGFLPLILLGGGLVAIAYARRRR